MPANDDLIEAMQKAGDAAYMEERFEESAMNAAYLAVARVVVERAAEVAAGGMTEADVAAAFKDADVFYTAGRVDAGKAIRALLPKEEKEKAT